MRKAHHSGRYAFTIFAQFRVAEANNHDKGTCCVVQIHPYAISTILDFLWAGPDLRPANGSPADLHDSVVEAVRMSGMPRPRRRHDVIEPVERIPAEQSASMVSIGVQGHGIAGSAGREFVGHRTSDRLFR
jgi:hypothetical protein